MRVVGATQEKSFAEATSPLKLRYDLRPDAIARLVHQGCISDQIHAMLGAGEKHVGAVARFEEADAGR